MMAKSNFIVRGGADFSGIKKELQKTQSQLGAFQKNAGKAMKSAAAGFKSLAKAGLAIAGVTSAVVALKESFTSFIELESAMMRVNFIFGDAAKNIQGFAQTASESFGMAESSVYNYASIYGNLFRNITKNSEENSKVTIAMLKASAVVASRTGRTMDDVMERIRSGLLGNTEAIEDLGINVNVGMLEMTDAFKKIANGRSWQQLNFYEQQQIRTLGILEQAHKNFGDEVQQGSAYSLASLSSAFKDLTSYAGLFVNAGLQPIIKALTEIVRSATAGIKSLAALMGLKINTGDTSGTDAQVKAQEALTDEIEETAKAQKKLAGFDEINILSEKAGADVAGASTDGGVFSGISVPEYEIKEPDTSWVPALKSSFAELADTISKKFAPTIEEWGKTFGGMAEPVKKAFSKIKSSMSTLWNGTIAPFGKYLVSDWIPSIVNGFSETFAPIFADVMPVLFNELANNFSFACAQIDRVVKDIYQSALELMKTVALDVFGGIKTAWDEHGAGILEGFQRFKDSLRNIWTSLYENVFLPVFTYIGNTVSWLWDNHLKPLWDNIADFVGSVVEFALMLWNQILSPFVTWIVERLGPHISFVIGMIGDIFGTVFAVIADIISGVIKSLSGVLDFLTGIFTLNWEKAWNGIEKIFGGIWDSIWGVVKSILNLIIDGLNTLWGGVYNVVKGIVDGIGGIAGALGKLFGQDWKFSMPATVPKIPKLAKGGIAYGRSIVEVAEYAGARSNPEVIAPLEKLKAMIAEVAGGDIVLENYLVLEDGTLIGRTTKKITRGSRMAGAPAVGV